jgi:integrase
MLVRKGGNAREKTRRSGSLAHENQQCKTWTKLTDITSSSIGRYISQRQKTVADPTIKKELSALSVFLKWSITQGYLHEMPTWSSPSRKTDYVPVWLSRDEVERVLEELPTIETHKHHHPIREYFTVIWATSLRAGAVGKLRWEDVDWINRTLRIRATIDKASNDRIIPLTDQAIETLRSIQNKKGIIFGKRCYRVSLRNAARRAGLPEEVCRRLGAHSFRHSRATDLLSRTSNLAAVRHMTGHKQLSSLQAYVHADLASARSLLEQAGEAGNCGGIVGEQKMEESPAGGCQQGKTSSCQGSAKGGSRTPTVFPPLEPESSASTNSATFARCDALISCVARSCQDAFSGSGHGRGRSSCRSSARPAPSGRGRAACRC